jgi:uncharacterized protein
MSFMDKNTNNKKSFQVSSKINKLSVYVKSKKPKTLDVLAQSYHDEVFEKIDCFDCANCCKSISPLLKQHDIERLANACKMTVKLFIEQYIDIDEDGDYVFKLTPCPFLANDNYCNVYKDRPRACREYPHTDRPRFYQIIDLSVKNASVCPAVEYVMNRLADYYNIK